MIATKKYTHSVRDQIIARVKRQHDGQVRFNLYIRRALDQRSDAAGALIEDLRKHNANLALKIVAMERYSNRALETLAVRVSALEQKAIRTDIPSMGDLDMVTELLRHELAGLAKYLGATRVVLPGNKTLGYIKSPTKKNPPKKKLRK